jgi:hypothetical protein
MLKWIFYFLLGFLSSCSIPPAAYILQVPMDLKCSENYDPTITQDPNDVLWKDTCASPAWIRFRTYVVQPDFAGWVFYKGSSSDDFASIVQNHLLNGAFQPLSQIVNKIENYSYSGSGSGICTQGNDDGAIYPTLPVNPRPQNTVVGGTSIDGLEEYYTPPLSGTIIIPPLDCLSGGTFVVTTSDYLNKAESIASNTVTVN